jgi:hypothetical protein
MAEINFDRNDIELAALPSISPSNLLERKINRHLNAREQKSDLSEETENGWSNDVEELLKDIEYNSGILSTIHKGNYLILHEYIKYFKLPIIILSSLNSIFSVGLSVYLNQQLVSSINCLISLICGIISSIELYLGIQKRIENELLSYRDYYLLSIKINNCLKLNREHRTEPNGQLFLTEITNSYTALFETSEISSQTFRDRLITLDITKTKNKLLI